MAELLVVVESTIHPEDFYANCCLPKRGDVIDVKEDGARWGKSELGDPRWRIVRIPGIGVSEAKAWLSREPDIGLVRSRTLQYRAFKLDVDALAEKDADFAAFLDGKDAERVCEAKLSLVDIRAAKVRRPRIEDPSIIGDNPHIIG